MFECTPDKCILTLNKRPKGGEGLYDMNSIEFLSYNKLESDLLYNEALKQWKSL